LRVYDLAGNVIEPHEHASNFKDRKRVKQKAAMRAKRDG
jgi:hypothetical protein